MSEDDAMKAEWAMQDIMEDREGWLAIQAIKQCLYAINRKHYREVNNLPVERMTIRNGADRQEDVNT